MLGAAAVHSDLTDDLVDRDIPRLGRAGLAERVLELPRQALKQRIVRPLTEDGDGRDRSRSPIHAEVDMAKPRLGTHLLRPEGLPLAGQLVGLALRWLGTDDPHVHDDPS